MEKTEPPAVQSGPDKADCTTDNNAPKDPSKLERVLTYLATGRSLHRFEAERLVNDHCLNSTMSDIKHDLGIPYRKLMKKVYGYRGHPTPVAHYWLGEDAQRMAWNRVIEMRKQRGATQ